MDPIVFAVLKDDPDLALATGETVVIDVAACLIRWEDGRTAPANYGRLLLAAETGTITWLSPAKTLTFRRPEPPRPFLRLIA